MTKKQREELVGLLSENRVRFDEPLKNHSSMGVGGPAEAFCTVENIEELKKLIGWASENDLEYRTWGGGTGTLVRDGGIRGVTLKLGKGFDFIETGRLDGEDIYLLVGAAMPTHNLVKWTVDNGFAGLEGLVGCCGTIGGNLITNAGTGVGVIGDSVEEITIINSEGRELSMKKSALRFEYRNLKLPRTAVIVRALLHLKRADANDLAARVNELSKKREETQPKDMKSLGCIFKNPGKTPAGVLIEEAGLKGVRVGGARVSTVHANFIVNEGKATARDVIVLMNLVRERVKEQSSAILEPEIAIVGDE